MLLHHATQRCVTKLRESLIAKGSFVTCCQTGVRNKFAGESSCKGNFCDMLPDSRAQQNRARVLEQREALLHAARQRCVTKLLESLTGKGSVVTSCHTAVRNKIAGESYSKGKFCYMLPDRRA